jgi:hypothetical protein
MGLKLGAIGNTLGEPIGNLKGTCLPLQPTYIGEKARTLGKTLGALGAYWELDGNRLGTWRNRVRTWKEHVGNKGKMKKSSTPQNLKEKNHRTLSACWTFPLAAWNIYSQNCSSAFLAWANTPHYKLGILIYIFCHSYLNHDSFFHCQVRLHVKLTHQKCNQQMPVCPTYESTRKISA